MDAREILQRHGIQYIASKKAEYTTQCPSCNKGYLSVKIGRESVQWYCHICKEGGGEKYNKPEKKTNGSNGLGPIVAVFDYHDETGKRLFQTLKFKPTDRPKDFRQRVGPEQEKWSVKGVRIVPFRLPELIEDLAQDRIVFIVEGEKDVNTLRGHGVPATTNPMGAGKWLSEWAKEFFVGADVVICPDNDQPGTTHAMQVARSLKPHAKRIRWLDLKSIWSDIQPSDDISDWFLAGGNVDSLWAAVEDLKDWEEPQPNGTEHPEAKKSTINFLSKDGFLKGFKPPNYLIVGLLQRCFVYSLTGQTGHAKTAIALLLAELVTSSDQYARLGPHIVKKGRCVYFVGENSTDIRMRVIGADSVRLKQDPDCNPAADKISFIDGVFNIEEMRETVAEKIATLGGVDLVIVDTSAAYFFGKDEISNTEIGEHARKLRRLTTLPGGPCVLILCHPIKHATESSQLLPRGGGAFLAEMDGNLTAWKDGDLIELYYTKLRGPGFEAMTFQLKRIADCDNLRDSDGRYIPTVRAVYVPQSAEDALADQKRDDVDLVFSKVLANPNGSLSDHARSCGWVNELGQAEKKRVWRILQDAVTAKLAIVRRGKYELTERGKEDARLAAIRFRTDGMADEDAPKDAKPNKVTPLRKAKDRLRILGPCDETAICVQCRAGDNVMRIEDTFQVGGKSETLHERCAALWFDKK